MKTATLAVLAVAMVIGLVCADFDFDDSSYGSYGGGYGGGHGGGYGYASYMPAYGGYGAGAPSGGFGQGGFLMLIGFLFIFTLLFQNLNSNTVTNITI